MVALVNQSVPKPELITKAMVHHSSVAIIDGEVIVDPATVTSKPMPWYIEPFARKLMNYFIVKTFEENEQKRIAEARTAADPLPPVKTYATRLFNLGETGNICFITKAFDGYTSRWWYVIDSNGRIHRVRDSDAPSARSFESVSDFMSDLSRFVNKYGFKVTCL